MKSPDSFGRQIGHKSPNCSDKQFDGLRKFDIVLGSSGSILSDAVLGSGIK